MPSRFARPSVPSLRTTATPVVVDRGGLAGPPISRRSAAWSVQRHDDGGFDLAGTGHANLKTSAIVTRCLDLMVNNLAERPLMIEGADGKPIKEPRPLTTVYNRDPGVQGISPVTSRLVFWRRYCIYGETHALLQRGPNGDGPVTSWTNLTGPIAKVVKRPDSTDVYLNNPYGELIGWYITVDGKRRFARASEVLWVRNPDPDDYWGALSPTRAALSAMGLHHKAREWQAMEFEGGSARAIVYINGATEDEIEAARYEVDSMLSGVDNAGRVAVAGGQEGGLTVTPLSLSAKEMSFIETLGVADDEVATAYAIPLDLIKGKTTYDNLAAAGAQLWTQNLKNKLAQAASAMDALLVPGMDETAKYDLSDVPELQENEDALVRRVQQTMYADLRTINEGRAVFGLGPIKGGDVTRTVYNAQQAALLQANPEADVPTAEPVELAGPDADGYDQRANTGALTSAEKIKRERAKHEAIAQRAMARLASQQEARIQNLLSRKLSRGNDAWAAEVRAKKNPLSGIWNDAEQNEMVSDRMSAWLENVYLSTALTTGKALKMDTSTFGAKPPKAVLDAVAKRADETTELVNATTKGALAAQLTEGLDNNEDATALAKRVAHVFSILGTSRAEMIALDTVLGGMHEATHVMVAAAGRKGHREWLCAKDERTRESHKDLDGYTTKSMKDAYPNGAMYPGHRAAKPSETIRCRCVELIHLDPVED